MKIEFSSQLNSPGKYEILLNLKQRRFIMEIGISNEDTCTLGFNTDVKERIVGLVHSHIGHVSAVSVKIVENPDGVLLETGIGKIVVDRDLTKRIDM